jgi:hypothetical protein
MTDKTTAMQELIEDLVRFKELPLLTPDVKTGLSIAIEQAQKLFEKEKEQIENAYITARHEFDKVPSITVAAAENYYNQTYKK